MDLFGSAMWSDVAWDVLALTLPKGFALAVVVFLIGRGLRRASASTRAAWWTTSALALITIPVLTNALPVWDLGTVPPPTGVFEDSVLRTGPTSGATLLLAIWALGVVSLLGRFVFHMLRVASMARHATPVEPLALGRLRHPLARRRCRVVRTARAPVPMTWGVREPVIMLPAGSPDWTPELMNAVLHHELAHVERRDYLGLIVLELCRALHWPNPLAWFLLHRARTDQERACDDAAMKAGIGAREYAHQLLAIGRHLVETQHPAAALPFARRGSLRSRVESVLAKGVSRRPAGARGVLATGTLVALLAAPLAALNPWICPEAPTWLPTVMGPALMFEASADRPPESALWMTLSPPTASTEVRPPVETHAAATSPPAADCPTENSS